MKILRALKPICSLFTESPLITRQLSMSSPPKVAKMTKFIGTHDMTFHCDDVTACFMLKQLDRFKDHEIVRSRDPEILARAEVVVDVGGELDIERLRLDHHQRSFNQTIKDYFPKMKTTNPDSPPRLSSSGLVYAVFGKDIITKQANKGESYRDLNEEDKKMIDDVFEKAYVEFFEEIDAIDNGINVASGDNLVYNYHINSGISSRVGRMNPLEFDATPEKRLELFKKAMKMVGSEISEGLDFLIQIWWPKRQHFRRHVLKRKEFDPSGQIVLVEGDHPTSWKSAIYAVEEELQIFGQVKYIIYHDGATPWRIQTVPVNMKSFESRLALKEEWRGKRDEDLQKVSGIPDATFVHMAGFTGGAKSLAGVKRMARISLGLE